MKLVIQRVKNSKVEVDGEVVGQIEQGFMTLVGITGSDTKENVEQLAKKMCNLRVFSDENDKMNLSIMDIKGELLLISQFTLYADCSRGNRPSFVNAAKPDYANELYEYFVECCKQYVTKVEKGIFGADMKVSLLNDGPVTIVLEN